MPSGSFYSDAPSNEGSRHTTYYGGGPPSGSSGGGGGGGGGNGSGYGVFTDVRIGGTTPPGAATGLYGLPGGTSSPPNPLAGAQSLVNSFYGPQQQLIADQLGRQKSELAKWQAGVPQAYQSGILNRDNALANQLLGLDKQQLGLEKGLISGQQSNLGKLRDILGKQKGLAGEQKANIWERLGIDEKTARDMAKRKKFDLNSNLTARGALNTVANERGTGRIGRDLQYELSGIQNSRSAADIQYRNQLLGLDEKGIGYDNQQLALNNKLANIGLDARRLDISQEQLNNALADGLYNIGLSGQTTINGLLDAMTGTSAQGAQLATTILQQILSYSGLPPDVLAQLNAALSPKPARPIGTVRDR